MLAVASGSLSAALGSPAGLSRRVRCDSLWVRCAESQPVRVGAGRPVPGVRGQRRPFRVSGGAGPGMMAFHAPFMPCGALGEKAVPWPSRPRDPRARRAPPRSAGGDVLRVPRVPGRGPGRTRPGLRAPTAGNGLQAKAGPAAPARGQGRAAGGAPRALGTDPCPRRAGGRRPAAGVVSALLLGRLQKRPVGLRRFALSVILALKKYIYNIYI